MNRANQTRPANHLGGSLYVYTLKLDLDIIQQQQNNKNKLEFKMSLSNPVNENKTIVVSERVAINCQSLVLWREIDQSLDLAYQSCIGHIAKLNHNRLHFPIRYVKTKSYHGFTLNLFIKNNLIGFIDVNTFEIKSI